MGENTPDFSKMDLVKIKSKNDFIGLLYPVKYREEIIYRKIIYATRMLDMAAYCIVVDNIGLSHDNGDYTSHTPDGHGLLLGFSKVKELFDKQEEYNSLLKLQ